MSDNILKQNNYSEICKNLMTQTARMLYETWPSFIYIYILEAIL